MYHTNEIPTFLANAGETYRTEWVRRVSGPRRTLTPELRAERAAQRAADTEWCRQNGWL